MNAQERLADLAKNYHTRASDASVQQELLEISEQLSTGDEQELLNSYHELTDEFEIYKDEHMNDEDLLDAHNLLKKDYENLQKEIKKLKK